MRDTRFSRFLPLAFCILVLFNGCLAQLVPCQQQQSPRLSGRSECQIDRITAREPNRRQVSEAGFSEFWDSGENDGLECAGVEVVRHTINPKGLLLPYYPNTHELVYVVRGRGIQGTVLSGCPETFETSFPVGGGRDEQFFDKHQRVYRYKEGDILALPAGAVHWTYNDGDTPIVTINLRDTSNVANQLDRNFRKFFLAGNPQSQRPDQGGQRPWGIPPQQEGKPYPGQQPSQHPGQGTGTSQRPWAGTDPYQRPWGTSEGSGPSEQPWGPSQRPRQEFGPSQRPWETRPGQETRPSEQPWGPSQRPGQGSGPSEQPWGPSQHPGQKTGPSQRPWGTRPGQETRPSEQPWGPSQRPSQGTSPSEQPWGPSQSPGQGTIPSQRPRGTSERPGQEIRPSQRPWGTSERPGQETSPSQKPWGQETSPSQRPWGSSEHPGQGTSPSQRPSEQPWGTSERPGQGTDPSQRPWETSERPGQGTGPTQRPWGTSKRPGQGAGPSEQPWSPSQHPGQGKGPSKQPWDPSQYPGQGTGPYEQPWGSSQRPSEQPWGTSGRPGQGSSPSKRPWGSSGRPGQGTGPYQRPSEQPWGISERPGQGTGSSHQPWGTTERPGMGTSPSQRPWGTSQRPGEGTGTSERPWGTSERPGQGTSSSQRPWGTSEEPWGSSEQPWRPSQHPGQGTVPYEQPWGSSQRPSEQPSGTGPSQRPIGKQEDPCEVCRRIRGEHGLGEPCANCNELRIQQEQEGLNMFSGFDNEILQEVFNVEYDIVWKLQAQNDDRGVIVYAENFQVNIPEKQEQRREMSSQQQGTRGIGRNNSIAQTICTNQLSANIASPSLADVYNPRGGRVSTLNSHKLPVLSLLQLSAETGVLYKDAVLAPHYNLNAHSIIYVTGGNSRLQIVRNDGSSVFDDVVREGQLIVVPQDFAVIKKAGEQGCEWVAFKTNDNAITTQLAGRFSFIRSLPEDVLLNSYDISREHAKNLKYNRQEGVVLSPLRTSSTMKKKAKNALLNALFG